MRILDLDNDKSIKNINIYLTRIEAEELLGDLKIMLESNKKDYHTHINDIEYKHEITLAIYDEGNLDSFDSRSQKIIQKDE